MSVAGLLRYEMAHCRSLDELCGLVAERYSLGEATVLLSGGTDWLVEREMAPPLAAQDRPPLVVDVSRLDDLRGIDLRDDVLRVGAATTYLELRRSAIICERAPLLERMSRDVGAIQIQARGTLGGNVATASPAADGVAALAAYDATTIVRSVRGERRIPFAELQTGYKQSTRSPDEVIVAFEMTLPVRGAPWCWRKVGTRRAQAISKVALAAVIELEGQRVVRFGAGMASVAPTTARLPATRALVGSRPLGALEAAEIDAAVEADISPIDDVRSTRAYRLHAAKAVVRGCLRDLGARV